MILHWIPFGKFPCVNKHSPDVLAQDSQTVCSEALLATLILLEDATPGKAALHYLIILFKCKPYVRIVFQEEESRIYLTNNICC